MRFLLLIFIACLLSACQLFEQPETTFTIEMYNNDGDQLGTATLTEDSTGVKVKLELEGLTPGFHGVHIHEKAKCEPPTFTSAGNHFNPENKAHGLLHPKGAHVGDLPNIEVSEQGKVNEELTVSDATLLATGNKSLTRHEGTALIITSDSDDGMTQISGNSGERIVCGEIKERKARK